ncbi:leucine-rich repeat protein [Ralstonia solanacearum]|uniref:GALA protein n=1 Tax=Ralstonia solanacearum TaxID=305 RepID=A0AAD0SAX2_RALSL|nr:leucine-rich repeat protein [Ralstonia solanacearum]AXV83969.1 GALA protein [Ralstonia solanacearum]AXW55098.1 GALA protein [Ralstonia solanacearum]
MVAPVSTRNAPSPSAPATADVGAQRGPNQAGEQRAYAPTRSSAGIASSPLGGLASLRRGAASASTSSAPRILSSAVYHDPQTAALQRVTHLSIHDQRALSELRYYPNLESVHLKGNFTLADLKALPATLLHLDLSECTGSARSSKAIAYLASLPLESLNVKGAQIGDHGARLLAANPSLKTLNVAIGGIGAAGAANLAESRTLMSLDLTQNKIGDKGVQALAASRSLTNLTVSNCLVTDIGLEALARSRTLTSLDLGNLVSATYDEAEQADFDRTANDITVKGTRALVQSPSLTSLSVQGNLCGDAGVLELAKSRTLPHLNVAFTNMGPVSARALARNPVLTSLNVRWNYDIGTEGALELTKSESLISLDARDASIGAEGVLALEAKAWIKVAPDDCNFVRAAPDELPLPRLVGDPGTASRTASGGAIQLFAPEARHGDASAHRVSAEGLASRGMIASIQEGFGLIGQYFDRMEWEYGLYVRDPVAQPGGTVSEEALPTLPTKVWQKIASHAGPRTRRALSTVSRNLRDAAVARTKHLTVWDKAAFSRLGNYSALESLSFHGNLTIADLKALPPSVRHLDLSGCTGTAVSGAGLAYLAGRKLESLDLSDTPIGDRGAQLLASSTSLTSLNLSGNEISDAGAAAFADNTSLTSLNLRGNHISDAGAEALGRNTVLTSLDVSANPIGNTGVQALASSRSLTSLNLCSTWIEDEGVEALASNTVLRSLDISHNRFGAQFAAELAQNRTLASLKANHCSLTNNVAQQLASIRSLTALELSSNLIDDAGVQAIVRNASLRSLDLSQNPIGLGGLHALALSRTLTSLDVSCIGCGDRGGLVLSKSRSLTLLKLGSNGIASEGVQILAANRSLISLDLSGNTIDVVAARALAKNPRLASLNASSCGLDDAAVSALAESRSLTSLDVSKNRLFSPGARALAGNRVLTSLNISHNRIGFHGAAALAESTSLTFLDARANGIGEAGALVLEANTRIRGTPQNPHFLSQDVPG